MRQKRRLYLLALLAALALLGACGKDYTVLDTITPAPEEDDFVVDDSFIPEDIPEDLPVEDGEWGDVIEEEPPAEDADEADFSEMPAYVPGTYRGEGDGYGGLMEVDVTLDEFGITAVQIASHKEDPKVAEEALRTLPDAILAAQSADVDAVSGATMTSDAIVSAVMNALGLGRIQ